MLLEAAVNALDCNELISLQSWAVRMIRLDINKYIFN